MIDVLLVAASGLAREVASASLPELRIVGILDDDMARHGTVVGGVEVLGPIELAASRSEQLLLCIGPGVGRRSVAERLRLLGVQDDRYVTAIDDSVRVAASCSIGEGSIILAGVVVTADVAVGRHVVIMPNVTITHDDVINHYATIAAGVALGGTVRVGEAAYLGMNSSVRPGLTIGEGATVGMGAVVLTSIPPGETWAGVPAHELRAQ